MPLAVTRGGSVRSKATAGALASTAVSYCGYPTGEAQHCDWASPCRRACLRLAPEDAERADTRPAGGAPLDREVVVGTRQRERDLVAGMNLDR